MFSVPSYGGLHPVVVHFPIALLVVAPLFLLLGVVWRAQSRAMLLSGSLLLVLGVGSMLLAVSTGEAAEDAAKSVPGAEAALHDHEEAAELARTLFIGLGVACLGLSGAYWRFQERLPRAATYVAGALYLGAYAACTAVLLNAAHQGGRLVHEFGVRAWDAGTAAAPPPTE